ncbi:MAG: hypothetical protein RL169_1519, partial [Armatimonadota bacterium]
KRLPGLLTGEHFRVVSVSDELWWDLGAGLVVIKGQPERPEEREDVHRDQQEDRRQHKHVGDGAV